MSERFEDAREYYDFLENKRTVRFHPHPTRCDQNEYPPFDLVLNSKINYDTLSERVGTSLNVPPTYIRLWTVNATTNNPKTPVRRGTNPSLRQILNPMGNSLNSSQRGDAFYFEVLEMSLAELDTKKNIKLTWLSEGITKEVCNSALCTRCSHSNEFLVSVRFAGSKDWYHGRPDTRPH
jgi:ubiquitin carboxyl-terminal hydrolase 7